MNTETVASCQLSVASGGAAPPLPVRCDVGIRPATMADLPFMDRLQKAHSKQLGYFPTQQFQGYIQQQAVLIAEDPGGAVGYCISKDRYLKRDELGVIYQLCVAPGAQRKLIAASLLKAVFERSAYGCRLYCCWCAQDIAANHFWESMGFVPIAFRAGGTGNGRRPQARVHIFWQRRIVEGDDQTKWWYPFQTNGGAIRADRIVFPIPAGTHWSEVRAVAVPKTDGPAALPEQRRALPGSTTCGPRELKKTTKPAPAPMGGFRFQSDAQPEPVKIPKEKKHTPPAAKIDPKYLKAARELRDRYLEHINSGALPQGGLEAQGKYDASRQLQAPTMAKQTPLLTAA